MILLASQSASRRRLLEAAGVVHEAVPAHVDEEALTESLRAEGHGPRDIADALAEAKGVKLSRRFPEALVLGCDTVLQLDDGSMLGKPADVAAVAQHLRILSGRSHQLISAAVMAQGGKPVWRAIQSPALTMRRLSEDFIASYAAQHGEAVLGSVGAYHFEGVGAQLFSKVEGDYFAILGLPLLPLLDYLRIRGVLPS